MEAEDWDQRGRQTTPVLEGLHRRIATVKRHWRKEWVTHELSRHRCRRRHGDEVRAPEK